MNKDRGTTTDANSTSGSSLSFNQPLITRCIIYVFYPNKTASGRLGRDVMQELLPSITGSLFGLKLDSFMSIKKTRPIQFIGHGFNEYLKEVYIHQFVLEIQEEITQNDAIGTDFNVAFRDISLDQKEIEGERIVMETEINLDDVAL